MAYREFGCEFEVGDTTRFLGLQRKTEVFCLQWGSDRCSACNESCELIIAYLFDAFHCGRPFVHLFFCLFICSFSVETFLCSLG